MRNRIKQRMLRRIALAFAVAAVAAPTAQAVPLEPGNSTPSGTTIPQQYGMTNAMPSDANRGDRIELARLNDRVGNDIRGLDGVENVRIEPRGLDNPVLVSDTSSFNWGDAGVGAGLAFAAILLAGAAALSVKQYDRLGQV